MDIQRVTLAIPQKLYQRARELARLRNKDVSELLAESIVLDEDIAEDPFVPELDPVQETKIAREEAAFLRLHPVLREKYPDQYVAIHEGKVVDHDPDLAALYLRIIKRFPDEFVWIAPVKEDPVEVFVFRSPRLVGDN